MLAQVLEEEFVEELQEDETLLENNKLRRLYRILTMPTPQMNPPSSHTLDQFQESVIENGSAAENTKVEDDDEAPGKKISFGSVLKKSIFSPNARIKSCLLSIANKCAECSIGTFCDDQEAFGELIKDLSANAIELITDSFVSTPFTKRIVNTSWHPDMESVVTMRTENSLIT